MNNLPSQSYNRCLTADWIRTEEYKMGEYALSFNELQYYSGEVDDKKIAKYTTQQQYYSMLILIRVYVVNVVLHSNIWG